MKSRKGNASCHIPNDAYRTNYDRIFYKLYKPGLRVTNASGKE
jgi:hypothetical protein